MTDLVVAVAAGCALELVETVEQTTTIEVRAAAPGCAWVEVELPPGVAVGEHRGKERLSDDTKRKLGEERFERSPRSVDGSGLLRVHVPDLLIGDRLELELELLRSPPYEGPPLWPPGDVRLAERLVLHVPPGDPQIRLYPGGGSSFTREQRLAFTPSEQHRGWPLEAPAEAEVRITTEPNAAAELLHDAAGWRIAVLPSEGTTRVTVAWDEPDAPTYGERAPEVEQLLVEAPDGEVRWDGDSWTLLGINERAVMPSREVLVQALDARFRGVALPEPGAPMDLRGRDPTWALAAELRPTVTRRAPIGRWPSDPLWPRKLVKARQSGALTASEGALVVWLYARQLGLDADWAMARPASTGPGQGPSPAGYTAPLVRVRIGAEERWIDPACGVCAPFELPPDLEGASALGPGVDDTPPPTVGRHEVEVTADRVRWALEGPPALLLRQWLGELPEAERSSALAGRIGGPGARLVEIVGLETAGEPIRVVTTLGEGLRADPLALPVPRDDVWVEWIGERTLTRPAAGDLPGSLEQGPLGWTRTVADGVATEVLRVTERRVPAEVARAFESARAAAPAEPVPAEPVPVEVAP